MRDRGKQVRGGGAAAEDDQRQPAVDNALVGEEGEGEEGKAGQAVRPDVDALVGVVEGAVPPRRVMPRACRAAAAQEWSVEMFSFVSVLLLSGMLARQARRVQRSPSDSGYSKTCICAWCRHGACDHLQVHPPA